MEITHRVAPDIFDYLGDVGGLNEIIFVVFGLLINDLSSSRTYAILMNRLFHLTDTLDDGDQALRELSNDPRLLKKGEKDFHAVELIPPFFLDLRIIWHRFICFKFCPKKC
jgi:hypothetical protein